MVQKTRAASASRIGRTAQIRYGAPPASLLSTRSAVAASEADQSLNNYGLAALEKLIFLWRSLGRGRICQPSCGCKLFGVFIVLPVQPCAMFDETRAEKLARYTCLRVYRLLNCRERTELPTTFTIAGLHHPFVSWTIVTDCSAGSLYKRRAERKTKVGTCPPWHGYHGWLLNSDTA